MKRTIVTRTFCVADVSNPEAPELLRLEPIEDGYSEMSIGIPARLLSEAELIDWGKTIWGDKVYSRIGDTMTSFLKGKDVYFNAEAHHIPSFRNVKVFIHEEPVDIDIKIPVSLLI